MKPGKRRLWAWVLLTGAAYFINPVAAAAVAAVGAALEMLTRPHTLRWGALGVGLAAGYWLLGVEWHDFSRSDAQWAHVLAAAVRVVGGMAMLGGIVGFIQLEGRFPPPRAPRAH